MKCGVCGGGFVFKGAKGKRPRPECSTKKESGSCSHRRTYYAEDITDLVFKGLADSLRSPEAVREYLAEYRVERERLAVQENKSRDRLSRQLNAIHGSLERLINAIADGLATVEMVKDKILALENDRERIQRELEAIPATVNVVELHPAAVTGYVKHIESLTESIARGKVGEGDRTALRALIDSIIIHPAEPGHLDLEVLGKLTALLGDVEFPPTARLRVGDFVGAG